MSVVHPTFIRTYADYLDWVATSPEAIVRSSAFYPT